MEQKLQETHELITSVNSTYVARVLNIQIFFLVLKLIKNF